MAPASYFEKPNHIRRIERDELAGWFRDAGLEIVEQTTFGFYWSVWWALFWAVGVDLGGRRHPLLNQWNALWQDLLDLELGPDLKQGLDEFLPLSQLIVARKPGWSMGASPRPRTGLRPPAPRSRLARRRRCPVGFRASRAPAPWPPSPCSSRTPATTAGRVPWSVRGLPGACGLGVALFFVLSGFLLSRPWVREVQTDAQRPRLGRYFKHRLARILPAYWVALAAILLTTGRGASTEAMVSNVTLTQGYTGLFLPSFFQTWSPGHRGGLLCGAAPAGAAARRRSIKVSLILLGHGLDRADLDLPDQGSAGRVGPGVAISWLPGIWTGSASEWRWPCSRPPCAQRRIDSPA